MGFACSVRGSITLAGNATRPATLAPGTIDAATGEHTHGTLTIGLAQTSATNHVTFNNHSRFEAKIGTKRAADKLSMIGAVNINGTSSAPSTIAVEGAEGAKPGVYTLIETTHGINGRFIAEQKPARGGKLAYSDDGYRLDYIIFELPSVIVVR